MADRIHIPEYEIRAAYDADRMAVSKLAAKYDTTIFTVYARMKEYGIQRRSGGDANRGTQARENNPNWKCGRSIGSQGYVLIRIKGVQVREHRVVAAEKLGRALRSGEVVHHTDGDRTNNNPDNLQVFPSQSEHMRLHAAARRELAALEAPK